MLTGALPLLALACIAIPVTAIGEPGPGPKTQIHLSPPLRPARHSATQHEEQHERYDGHQVWRVDWSSLDDSTRQDVSLAIETLNLDVWRATRQAIDVRVPPTMAHIVRAFLPLSASVDAFVSDVQILVDTASVSEEPLPDWNLSTIDTSFHDEYHTLGDIYAFGHGLSEQFSSLVTEVDIGTSAEGWPIRGWSVHAHPNESAMAGKLTDSQETEVEDDDPELEFIIQAGSHAREWVGPSAAMFFLHSIILDGVNDPESPAGKLLNTFTFTVIPVLNPDGYEYSREHSRLWRKNRQEVGGLLCKGIDLNSNWGYMFKGSRTACSDSYSGQEAFEAPETRAMANYLVNGTSQGSDEPIARLRKVMSFVDLHSYGQLFMFPFAYSCADFPPDAEMLMEAGIGVAKAMRTTQQGQGYQTGQACDLTFRAPGDAIDYAYGVADIRWSYSAELRDTGTYGFLLPPQLIRPTGDEVSAGLRYLAKFVYDIELDM